jgi:hypothetical protein
MKSVSASASFDQQRLSLQGEVTGSSWGNFFSSVISNSKADPLQSLAHNYRWFSVILKEKRLAFYGFCNGNLEFRPKRSF